MKNRRKLVLALFNKYEKILKKSKLCKSYYFKTLVSVYLFDFLDKLRINNFPENWYSSLEKNLYQLLKYSDFFSNSFEFSMNSFEVWSSQEKQKNIELKTGEVYFQLWKNFKKEENFKQTTECLKERFRKNDIDIKGMKNVLDDGCGNGRYAFALKALGCRKVTGIDICLNSIKLAKEMNPYSTKEVNFIRGSALKLPFKNESFDFVLCNGVLHHTLNTKKGLREIYRVMKTKAKCWLYLYGGKESLFWDIVDFSRKLLVDVPQNYVQTFMSVMGYPPGRIFHRTDFFYTPINRRYFISEIEQLLRKTGFKEFRRLKRGFKFDWDEIIYNNPKIDPYIYGEGEIRYLIVK